MTRRLLPAAALLAALAVPFLAADEKPRYAGPTGDGFLLPNGWTLTPAGAHATLPDLPLNIIPLADNNHALVATSGYNQHQLALVELSKPAAVETATVRQSWFGLATD